MPLVREDGIRRRDKHDQRRGKQVHMTEEEQEEQKKGKAWFRHSIGRLFGEVPEPNFLNSPYSYLGMLKLLVVRASPYTVLLHKEDYSGRHDI